MCFETVGGGDEGGMKGLTDGVESSVCDTK